MPVPIFSQHEIKSAVKVLTYFEENARVQAARIKKLHGMPRPDFLKGQLTYWTIGANHFADATCQLKAKLK